MFDEYSSGKRYNARRFDGTHWLARASRVLRKDCARMNSWPNYVGQLDQSLYSSP